jgi:hypothetical protein
LAVVYTNDVGGLDLIIIGAVTVDKEGNKSTHEFVARCLVDESGFAGPRVKLYQVLIPTSMGSQLSVFSTETHK